MDPGWWCAGLSCGTCLLVVCNGCRLMWWRLTFAVRTGFRCNRTGNLIEWRGDWGHADTGAGVPTDGHRLHGGVHPVLPEFNYHGYQWRNGRSHTGSCNVVRRAFEFGIDLLQHHAVRIVCFQFTAGVPSLGLAVASSCSRRRRGSSCPWFAVSTSNTQVLTRANSVMLTHRKCSL